MEPLDGYRVVDLSTGIAGAYCTKLLADAGAEVIKVEPPEGDWLRRWSASHADLPPGADGALFGFLACSKQSVVVDADGEIEFLDRLLAGADAVVWSRGSRVAEHPSLAPEAIRDRHSHLTVAAITPFGLHGPWSDRPATEFTVQAWSGGIIGLGRGAPDRAPVSVGGQPGEWTAGAYAAAGILAARWRTLRTGVGELLDLSMLETQILTLTYYSVTFFESLGRLMRPGRGLMVPGVATAKDGLVAVGCGTAQQWFDLCAMIGHPEWIDESAPFSISGKAGSLADEISPWFADHTVEEILGLATAFRIPNSRVANGENIAEMDHYASRGSFVTNPRDGYTQPGPPYRLGSESAPAPRPAPRLGEHGERYRAESAALREVNSDESPDDLPFKGIRVLDMTAFWAGPSCTHLLGMLGAEVIHLESAARPDGTRLIAGVPLSEEQWWERSPIFSSLNTNKKSVTLDFRTERGLEVLHRLIRECDVIVENYTPRVLEHLGLDYETVRGLRPDVIMVRMPGFGLDGPWRDNPAFAYIIEDASGLTWLTGHPDQNPVEPFALGDPNAGLHGATALLLALEHRRRTGNGMLVEAAMADAAINIAAEQVVEHSAYGKLLERDGNRGPGAAPQNLYRTADVDEYGGNDSWVAVAVATDDQWVDLRTALGKPDWAMRPELSTADGRREHHDLIDEHLATWCEPRSGDEIVEILWDAGVPVAKVMQPHRIAELPQLVSRGFFESVDHPVNSPVRHATVPFTLAHGSGGWHRRHAPLLGEHNREVLAGLGFTDSEIDTLEADGVIGTAPALREAAKEKQ
ncbi:CaiB/BaiF CoA-transferase family protein [Nocardia alni]|uniref:CaiB/BaiF CoA-transferase family protein n=1 Tax=Nocardia alni TaxID=2815723 RepID=UPI001C212857|nr:CoA transferase [Nocardia alni]